MRRREIIYQVIDEFGHLRDYGTDEQRALTLAAGVFGRVEPVAAFRWYKPQHFGPGPEHPADRDNAREIVWEQQRLLEAYAEDEWPAGIRPNRFGPPLFAEDGF